MSPIILKSARRDSVKSFRKIGEEENSHFAFVNVLSYVFCEPEYHKVPFLRFACVHSAACRTVTLHFYGIVCCCYQNQIYQYQILNALYMVNSHQCGYKKPPTNKVALLCILCSSLYTAFHIYMILIEFNCSSCINNIHSTYIHYAILISCIFYSSS